MKSVTSKTFDNLYRKLNTKQKQAVDAIEGPVIVLAGPGTGKTHILTLRIANILRCTDTPPESILALTFTESAVFSMRRKLVDIIGNTAYRISIYTFHSFCNEIIRTYPEDFERIIGASHIADIDQIKLIERLVEATPLAKLKPYGNTFYYVQAILSSIRALKREDYTPEDFSAFIREQEHVLQGHDDLHYTEGKYKGKMKGAYIGQAKRIEMNKELLVLYTRYQEELAKQKQYDYEDMLMEAVRVLGANEDLLLRIQEQYHYILADEHQDANNAQNKLLTLLASFHDNPNLFVVGDAKQAIYRFQGASLENFLSFTRLYKNAFAVNLEEHYRSPQKILDGAQSLIQNSHLPAAFMTPLKSTRTQAGTPITVHTFMRPEDEMEFIASDVQKRMKCGESLNESVLLYRDNKDAVPIMEALERKNIPFIMHSEQNILADEDIQKLLLLLRAVHDLGDSELLAKALFVDFLNIEPFDVYALLRVSRKERIPISVLLRSPEKLAHTHSDFGNTEQLYAVSRKFAGWNTLSKNRALTTLLDRMIAESGMLAHLLNLPNASMKLGAVSALLEAAQHLTEAHHAFKLGEFLEYLLVLETYGVAIASRPPALYAEGVQLMTAHRAKGLEFDRVYITGLMDGHWGNRRRAAHFDLPMAQTGSLEHNNEERRLFYVALTRARKEAVLTMASQKSGEGRIVLPSQFVGEIEERFLKRYTHEASVRKPLQELRARKNGRVQKQSSLYEDKKVLNTLFLEQGLSVTALNNYVRCPWNYFFTNLIRVPQTQGKAQLYGTAVHDTLRMFFEALKWGRRLSKKRLLEGFERSLEHMALSDHDFDETLKKGRRALSGYYDYYKGTWKTPLLNECDIGGVTLEVPFSRGVRIDIVVRGKLDKLERVEGDNVVNVVDYKTSMPRSRNDIEGKTKNSTGDYKRQLVFYRLLLDRFSDGRYSMATGEIDFIEPAKNGTYRKERFAITADDIDALTDQIREVAREIYTLSFWDKRCTDKACKHCALRAAMKQ